jgi:hypothetical protein
MNGMSRLRLLTLALAILVSSRAYAQEQPQEAGSEPQAEAVQETVEEAEPVGYQYEDEAVIQMALEETLSQPEFERLRKEPEPKEETRESGFSEWLDKLLERLARAIWGDDARKEDSSSLAFNLPGAGLLIYAMAAIILIAAVFFIAKSVLAISRDKKISRQEAESQVFGPESAPGELDPEEYFRRALSHGARKRYKEGLRDLLLGAMSAAERRGLIRFRRGLTNRDYWYSVRGPARESFSSIATAFEHVYFGRRDATVDAFHDSCRAFQKSFREASS